MSFFVPIGTHTFAVTDCKHHTSQNGNKSIFLECHLDKDGKRIGRYPIHLYLSKAEKRLSKTLDTMQTIMGTRPQSPEDIKQLPTTMMLRGKRYRFRAKVVREGEYPSILPWTIEPYPPITKEGNRND